MDKLIKALQSVEKPHLSAAEKKELKTSLMENIKRSPDQQMYLAYGGIVAAIRKAVAGIKVQKETAVTMKARVMEMVENHSQKRFFWSNFFSWHKSFASAFVAVLVFFGVFNFMSIQPKVVGAASFTTLVEYEGGVLIERDGEFIDLELGMRLYEGDKITTTNDGVAVIQYFDDSVTRMAVDTQILINDLAKPNQKSSSSYVEVSLLDGELWSRVVNVVEDQSAFVVEAGDTYTSAKKAAFNVSHEDNEVEVGVFNYSVEVKKNDEVDKVVTGEKIVVQKDTKVSFKAKIDSVEKSEEWVTDNLEEDKVYITAVEDRILAAKVEYLGVNSPEDASISEASLKDNTMLLLTFDDVKKAQLKLDMAEKNFVAAQLKLENSELPDEEKELALEAIASFVTTAENYHAFIDEIKYRDEGLAMDLESYLEEKIDNQKKGLSGVDSENPVYVSKEALDDVKELIADNDEELLVIKKGKAQDKLNAVEDAVNSGNFELADKTVDEFKAEISETATLVETIGGTKGKEKVLQDFADDVSDDLAVLTAVDDLAAEHNVDILDENDTYEVLEIAEKVSKSQEESEETEERESTGTEEDTTTTTSDTSTEESTDRETSESTDSSTTRDEDSTQTEESSTVETEIETVIEEVIIEKEETSDGPFGLIIEGDKLLDPLIR